MRSTRVCINACRVTGKHYDTCPDQDTCPGCLPREAHRGHLCDKCYSNAEKALAALPGQYDALAQYLPPGSNPSKDDGHITGSGTEAERVNFNLTVANHRDRILRWLAYYVDTHATALRHNWPLDYRNPHVAADWLSNRLDWAAGQDWAGEYVWRLQHLTGIARSLLDPQDRKKFSYLGPCVKGPCKGRVVAYVPRAGATDERLPLEVCCSDNPAHNWDSTQLRRLGHMIKQKEQALKEAA